MQEVYHDLPFLTTKQSVGIVPSNHLFGNDVWDNRVSWSSDTSSDQSNSEVKCVVKDEDAQDCSSKLHDAVMFLQHCQEDVVIHSESLVSQFENIVENSSDTRSAIICCDISSIIRRLAHFNETFPDVEVAFKAGFTSDDTISGLLLKMHATLAVESIPDIRCTQQSLKKLQPSAEDSSFSSGDTEHSAIMDLVLSRSAYGHSSIDVCTTRSPSRVLAALQAGSRVMCVDSGRGVDAIARGIKRPLPLVELDKQPDLLLVLHPQALLDGHGHEAGEEEEAYCVSSSESGLQFGQAVEGLRGVLSLAGAAGVAASAALHGLAVVGVAVPAMALVSAAAVLFGGVPAVVDVLVEYSRRFISGPLSLLYLEDLDAVLRAAAGGEGAVESLNQVLAGLRAHFPSLQVKGDGTQFLTPHMTLLTRVVSTRPVVDKCSGAELGQQVYVNDGVYSCLMDPHQTSSSSSGAVAGGDKAFSIGVLAAPPRALLVESKRVASPAALASAPAAGPCTLWGQTCDSIDKIAEMDLFPWLAAGDWVAFSIPRGRSAATPFNGYDMPTHKYFVDARDL